MTQQTSPFLEGKYGWALGESNWNLGMDENLVKFSYMFDRNIDAIVASLPAPVNGQAYFLTTDNRLYFGVAGTFYSSPTPKWCVVTIRSTGVSYQFNGSALVAVPNNTELDTRLDTVELELAGLGTAADFDASYFATQTALNSAITAASTYTDTLRTDLASSANLAKGAGQVGFSYSLTYAANTVGSWLKGLAASTGASLVGYIQSGTGFILRTVASKISETKSIEDFGAIGDGVADDTAAFVAARNWAFNRLPLPSEVVFTGNKYRISASPNWCISNFRMTTVGRPEIALTSGAAASACALLMDGQALVPGKSYYGMEVGDFILTGNAGTLAVFKTTNVTHSKFGQILTREASPTLGCGFYIGWGVCNTYQLVACSTNETAMTNIPLRGMFITSSAGLPTTDCTFHQHIMEGPPVGTAIDTNGGEFNLFDGGTDENCSNTGFSIGPGCKGNRLIGLALEGNGSYDIVDQGTETLIEGGYSTKIIQFSLANGSTIRNMRTQVVNISSDSVRVKVDRVVVSSFGAGSGVINFSTSSIITDVWNTNTSIYQFKPVYGQNPTQTLAGITVGASPFSYTNATNYSEQIVVRSGTVSNIEIVREGTPTSIGGTLGLPAAGVFTLSSGDVLKVTYSVVPEMIKIPR